MTEEHRGVPGRIHQVWMPPWMTKVLGVLAAAAILGLTTCSIAQRDTVMLYEQRLHAVEEKAQTNFDELEKREEAYYSIGEIDRNVKAMRVELRTLTALIRELP